MSPGRTVALLLSLVVTCVAAGELQTQRWAEAAYRWLQRDCHHCLPPHRSQARLYVATPHPKGRLRVVSADGGARHAGQHDAVLVIDPHPDLPFGHPLYMFFVDLDLSRQRCEDRAGVLLEGGDCLVEWRRARCSSRRARQDCPLLHLPEVREGRAGPDLLLCADLWAPCPRPRLHPHRPHCDTLATNGRGCPLPSPCLFMTTCNHAIILSGGWNKQLADEESFKNVHKINNMLKRNGFAQSNIQIFYANGLSKNEEELYGKELGNVYPSSLKFAFRFLLKSLCEIKHCSNTLFIYLNSPTMPDGTSLLWDTSGNGEFDDSEVYTVKELLGDIGNCKSRRLVIVADQSYPGELVKGLRKQAAAFQNAVVLARGEGRAVGRLEGLGPGDCLPELGNRTLTGAPCDGHSHQPPPACQNLSTFEMLEPEQLVDLA